MRKLLVLFMGLLLLGACQEEGQLELNVIAKYDDNSLSLNDALDFGGFEVKFENLTLLMTDLELVSNKGEVVNLSDVEFFSLNDGTRGQTEIYENIKGGNYNQIRFNIGVPEDLNKTTPSDYSVEEPLGRNDHYWEAWGSYIFAKTEGSADPDGDGVFDLKWFYHTGSDALVRRIEMEVDVTIDDQANTILALTLDYNKLLKNDDGSYFDIVAKPRNHNPEDTEIITKLVNNYDEAFGKEF